MEIFDIPVFFFACNQRTYTYHQDKMAIPYELEKCFVGGLQEILFYISSYITAHLDEDKLKDQIKIEWPLV